MKGAALASAEAAEDDSAFASDRVENDAGELFLACQRAWDSRDYPEIGQLVGPDLYVEWERRLRDFESKGWHNRVRVHDAPKVAYMGLVNREKDEEDRVVVEIQASLDDYVLDANGRRIARTGEPGAATALHEYWTLAKRDGRWTVASIEQAAEGLHHLDSEIIASPWADSRVADEALVETAVADKLPEGFTPADVADLDFDGDARAAALDAGSHPATMTIAVELGGRRYVEDRDTAAVLSGSREAATTFTEHWTLALDGPESAPWRLVDPLAGRRPATA